MYFSGPTPIDRGEREKQDALFLEPRFRAVVEPPQPEPPLLTFDIEPFEHVLLTLRLRATGPDARDVVRSVFAGVPVSLLGSPAILSVMRDASYPDGEFDVELEAGAPGRSLPPRCSAHLYGGKTEASVDGQVLLHPLIPVGAAAPVLVDLPTDLVQRIGFELQLSIGAHVDEQASVRQFIEDVDNRLVKATVDALRMHGPIVRRDPNMGDVVRISDGAELGVWAEWSRIVIVFQRTGECSLWQDITGYPLGQLVTSILRRAQLIPVG